MSEEEIIEYIKGYLELDGDFIGEHTYKAIADLLDLYNKQKEEIEELKSMVAVANKLEKEIKKKFISKDKIREILKKYEKRPLEDGICFYKEIENLLEEK